MVMVTPTGHLATKMGEGDADLSPVTSRFQV